MRRCAGAALLLAAAVLALAQGFPRLTVERESGTITIENRSPSAEGARTFLQLAGCEEGVALSIFYGPAGEGVVTQLDEATVVRSDVVLSRRPQDGADAGAAEGERDTVEWLDGEIAFQQEGRPCVAEHLPGESPRVELTQGRTRVEGARLFLDQETDVAVMDGPVALERAPEGDAAPLVASAASLRYDLDTERSSLSGGVRVEQGARVSEAEELELDEEAGVAVLRGSPARSTEDGDVVEGRVLRYYLDSNDVVVEGGVKGTLELELD